MFFSYCRYRIWYRRWSLQYVVPCGICEDGDNLFYCYSELTSYQYLTDHLRWLVLGIAWQDINIIEGEKRAACMG